jgi:hypothetical protein
MGICSKPLGLGAPCDPDYDTCDFLVAGLFCDPSANTCRQKRVAGPGQACDPGLVDCRGGEGCPDTLCPIKLPQGSTCTTTLDCASSLYCFNAKCVVRDPTLCR